MLDSPAPAQPAATPAPVATAVGIVAKDTPTPVQPPPVPAEAIKQTPRTAIANFQGAHAAVSQQSSSGAAAVSKRQGTRKEARKGR